MYICICVYIYNTSHINSAHTCYENVLAVGTRGYFCARISLVRISVCKDIAFMFVCVQRDCNAVLTCSCGCVDAGVFVCVYVWLCAKGLPLCIHELVRFCECLRVCVCFYVYLYIHALHLANWLDV